MSIVTQKNFQVNTFFTKKHVKSLRRPSLAFTPRRANITPRKAKNITCRTAANITSPKGTYHDEVIQKNATPFGVAFFVKIQVHLSSKIQIQISSHIYQIGSTKGHIEDKSINTNKGTNLIGTTVVPSISLPIYSLHSKSAKTPCTKGLIRLF